MYAQNVKETMYTRNELVEQLRTFQYAVNPAGQLRLIKIYFTNGFIIQKGTNLDIIAIYIEKELDSGGYLYLGKNWKKSKAFKSYYTDCPTISNIMQQKSYLQWKN